MPQAIAIPAIAGAATIAGSALRAKGQRAATREEAAAQERIAALQYKLRPERRAWAEYMMGKYPTDMGPLGPESVALARRLMGGELVPGVERTYGAGAEREYGGLASRLSEIGAGPATMALARAGVMRRLGETLGGARERAVEAGMGFAPEAYLMSPEMAALQKWGAERDIFLETPGAAYMPGVAGAPGAGGSANLAGLPFGMGARVKAMRDRLMRRVRPVPQGVYGPAAEAWRRQYGYYR